MVMNKRDTSIYAARIQEALTALNNGDSITHELLRFEDHQDVEDGNFAIIIYRDEDWAECQYMLEISFYHWEPVHFKGQMPCPAFTKICTAISGLREAE